MAAYDTSPKGLATLEALYTERGRIERALLAPLTQSGYANDWRAFARWCKMWDLDSLPASPDTVTLFAVDLLSRGRKTSTVRRLVSGVTHVHRREGKPVEWTGRIDDLLAGARRLQPETLEQSAPLTIEVLREMSAKLAADNTARSLRNRAILVTGFCSALRSASLVDLQLADVEFEPRGVLLHIRKEKNDQAGKGRMIGLPAGKHPETSAPGCLRDWVARRTSFAGALFTHVKKGAGVAHALTPEHIGIIVKRSLIRISRDPVGFSSHSMRAGVVTAAGEANISELIIARTTGHRDLAMVRRYFRRRDAFHAALCSLLDL